MEAWGLGSGTRVWRPVIPRVLGLLVGRPVADGGRVRVLLKGAPEQMTALYSSYAQGDADPKPMDEARAVHPPAPVPPGRCMHPLFRPAAVQYASRPLVHERASSDLMLPAPRVCYVVALSLSLSPAARTLRTRSQYHADGRAGATMYRGCLPRPRHRCLGHRRVGQPSPTFRAG